MIILGIETSCDDTGIAIYDTDKDVISHSLASQISTHAKYGGVVPELASRDHVINIAPLLDHVVNISNIKMCDINLVAYTNGPGLIGSLLTGACFAKSFAYSISAPSLEIHHLEAHILIAKFENPKLEFPFLAMLASGGHTMLVYVKKLGEYIILGQTLDDAIGEAFDKTAKMLGIPYPGGPTLAAMADSSSDIQQQLLPPFPRPLCDKSNMNFSFSGLKTHALNVWQKSKLQNNDLKYAIAYQFQKAVIDTILFKVQSAIKISGLKSLVLAGGVAANSKLRQELRNIRGLDIIVMPPREFCTDNGAMIAYAASLYAQQDLYNEYKDDILTIRPLARWNKFL